MRARDWAGMMARGAGIGWEGGRLLPPACSRGVSSWARCVRRGGEGAWGGGNREGWLTSRKGDGVVRGQLYTHPTVGWPACGMRGSDWRQGRKCDAICKPSITVRDVVAQGGCNMLLGVTKGLPGVRVHDRGTSH